PGSASGRELVRGITTPEQGRDLVTQLGDQLARLHKVAPPMESLSFLKEPAGVPALARVQEYRAALDAIPRPHPVLEWALNWLEDHAPDSGLRALCQDRKSTRLNSSHVKISYAVFCLKKKKKTTDNGAFRSTRLLWYARRLQHQPTQDA